MEPASTKGQNFFHTVTTKPLYFSKIKNLNDSKLDALSKFQIKIFFHHIYNNSNLHSIFIQQLREDIQKKKTADLVKTALLGGRGPEKLLNFHHLQLMKNMEGGVLRVTFHYFIEPNYD